MALRSLRRTLRRLLWPILLLAWCLSILIFYSSSTKSSYVLLISTQDEDKRQFKGEEKVSTNKQSAGQDASGQESWTLVAVVPSQFDPFETSHRNLFQDAYSGWKQVDSDKISSVGQDEGSVFGPPTQIVVLVPSDHLEKSMRKVLHGKASVVRISTNTFGTPLLPSVLAAACRESWNTTFAALLPFDSILSGGVLRAMKFLSSMHSGGYSGSILGFAKSKSALAFSDEARIEDKQKADRVDILIWKSRKARLEEATAWAYTLLARSRIPPFSYTSERVLNYLITTPTFSVVDVSPLLRSYDRHLNDELRSSLWPPMSEDEIRANLVVADAYSQDSDLSVKNYFKINENCETGTGCLVRQKIDESTVTEKRDLSGSAERTDSLFNSILLQQANVNKEIIVLGVNGGYTNFLLNLLCRLEALGIDNYVVVSFDSDALDFSIKHRIPTFASAGAKEVAKNAAEYGTDGFRRLTKVKSHQVLRVLRAGYHVLWSDVDIFWLRDPRPDLRSRQRDILVQSNAPINELKENQFRRINSGFYFVKSNENTIKAFDAIVKHAAKSKLSEQPSFYSILCGDRMERTIGPSECRGPAKEVITGFLPRSLYPNGNVTRWESFSPPMTEAKLSKGPIIVHNNWISGATEKVDRFLRHGLWIVDDHGECMPFNP